MQKIDDSDTSRALVRTVIDLARAVGGTTVAAGVENQRQLDILSDLKCDLVQGFLFLRPLPAADLANLLVSRNQKDQLLPLPARSTASKVTRRAGGQAEIIRGVRQIEAIVPSLAKFHHYVDAPITARWPWLSPRFQLHPEADMFCLLVRSTNDRIEGAAILARQPSKVGTRFFSVDNQMANVSSIFARNAKAADSLARGIADLALSTNGSWFLELDQISGSNRVAEALASLLPGVSVETQLPVPQEFSRPPR